MGQCLKICERTFCVKMVDFTAISGQIFLILMLEILYTCTSTCFKNILKISGPTPTRKPNYCTSKFSIFLVYFSNPKKLDKIRIFSSLIYNFLYFSTFEVDSTL